MTDTVLFSGQTGEITPSLGTFEVTDPMDFKTLVIEGFADDDHLNMVRRNNADDDWEEFTAGGKQVQLNIGNRSCTPLERGVYGLNGNVDGTIKAYTKGP